MATAINIDRAIFSRLVVVSEKWDIDLKEVHSYELAQVPLSLANMDGTLCKTAKSILLKELEIERCSGYYSTLKLKFL